MQQFLKQLNQENMSIFFQRIDCEVSGLNWGINFTSGFIAIVRSEVARKLKLGKDSDLS